MVSIDVSGRPTGLKSAMLNGLALSALGLGLVACGAGSNTPSETQQAVTERILFANTRLPPQQEQQREMSCPQATILDGTAAYRVGEAGTARGVSHQAAIFDLARECKSEGGIVRIKVGIQGRLVLGENGKPGTYTIPVRIAVRGDGKTLQSKLVPVSVTIPPSETQSPFVTVDDTITVPITAEDPGEQYTVLVGLDPQGGPRAARRRR